MQSNKTLFPGAVDITNDEYHGETDHISKSGLVLIKRSPAHYHARYLDPQREPEEPTPAKLLGTAIHSAVLEPDLFGSEYATVPADAPRKPTSVQRNAKKPSPETLDAIAWWDEFSLANAGRTILSADDYAKCLKVRDAVYRHKIARALLEGAGYIEQTFFFEEPNTGAPCKVRPDRIPNDRPLIVDLKTAEDASPAGFGRAAHKYHYHMQAPFYLDGVGIASGQQLQGFVFVAVEKEPPYGVGVYHADEAALQLGRAEYLKQAEVYAECRRTGVWPCYPEQVTPLALPAWAFPKDQQDNNYIL